MRAAEESPGGRVRMWDRVAVGLPLGGSCLRTVGVRAVRVAAVGKGPGGRASRELLIKSATLVRSIGAEVNIPSETGEAIVVSLCVGGSDLFR